MTEEIKLRMLINVRKRPGTNLLVNPPSRDVVKWVIHNRSLPFYSLGICSGEPLGWLGLWGIGLHHMSHCGRVCAGVRRRGREVEARIQQGCPLTWMSPSSHHHPPLRCSAPPLSLKTRRKIPGTAPVPLHCSSVWGKKESTKPQRG